MAVYPPQPRLTRREVLSRVARGERDGSAHLSAGYQEEAK